MLSVFIYAWFHEFKYNKRRLRERLLLTNYMIFSWLGLKNLFQTFELPLDVDKLTQQIAEIKELLNKDKPTNR